MLSQIGTNLSDILSTLQIDDYHRRYLGGMLPNIDYYIDIYTRCLDKLSRKLDKRNSTLVDYGGGHGLLSIVAKQAGWHNVIYIDRDPEAANCAKELSQALSVEIDTLLTGDANVLADHCTENNVAADALLGMDVIEHIYDLDTFFSTLFTRMPCLRHMSFTTASNPYNRLKCHKLRKLMDSDDTGSSECPNYYTLRYNFLTGEMEMEPKEAASWARNCRGLIYEDIRKKVELRAMPHPTDRHNTCDPRTGNWTERILPIDEYRKVVTHHGATLSLYNGFFNEHHHGLKGLAAKMLNTIDSKHFAPFIVLEIDRP